MQNLKKKVGESADFFVFSTLFTAVRGVDCIIILLIKPLCDSSEGFAEALIVNYFALTEEFNYVVYIGIVGEAENVIVGNPCLLLC